ncbi:polysaccharide biosynthesis protein [Halomonas getboli]|uniref:polysaccharide biosynthesis protein n=1 Tax=Halomonas getboli TaxID=2935862 RepID=UPI001FFFFEDB|nr:nucleoside-diphosphate sugar epimerase/dehydratase [Halomonas getboli]MCK2183062.1 polysaccharide biosynthesis protein [Halomonas getboli]
MIGLNALVRLPRRYKRGALRLADMAMMLAAFLLAIPLAERSETLASTDVWLVLGGVVLATPLVFGPLGVYRIVLRFMHLGALLVLCEGVAVVVGAMLLADLALGWPITWQVAPVFAMLAVLGVGGIRLLLRELYEWSREPLRRSVIIYGAGAAGGELARALKHGDRYRPRAFVDDWRGLQGSLVEGLPVHAPEALDTLIGRFDIELVLLAMPSTPRCRRREILEHLARLSIPVQTIPAAEDLVGGRARVSDTRDVQVEDLLGREPVPPFPELMRADLADKVVMVTGAGGSIGAELCRQVIAQRPRTLVMVDSAEFGLYAIEQELKGRLAEQGNSPRLHALLASVQQGERMREILDSFHVQTVYHAAAYKHVPMVECNLVEGLRNNVFGTLALVLAAVDTRVERFVLVSTDKAVRPTNVMGATKRLTELICQAFAATGDGRPRFSMVRFGNVLGSSGSVVPLFRRQIERGGPLEVTHPDITRYFMTIPEAAQLVIQAGAMSRGGEVYVLDMGEPVRIADLASQMVRLSGLEVRDAEHPDGDIEIVYTGLRPGEKLYEELLIGGDVGKTRHPRIMTSREHLWPWEKLEPYLMELHEAMTASQHGRIQRLLLRAPLGYAPEGRLVDLVWEARHARPPLAPTGPSSPSSIAALLQERFRSSGPA